MKKKLNKVLNIVVTLMAAIALMLGNVTSVAAYTDVNGYPLTFDDMSFSLFSETGRAYTSYGDLDEDNVYSFEPDSLAVYNNLIQLRFGSFNSNYIFPYDPENYDYYIVGTYAGKYNSNSDVSFIPTDLQCLYYDSGDSFNFNSFSDVQFYDYSNYNFLGHSFVGKFSGEFNPSFGYLIIHGSGCFTNYALFSASIVPVPKAGSETDALSSILYTLTQINQNIITGNTLQQTTIDAINSNTNAISNWFNTLLTTMQGWYNTQTENLRTWFYMLEERMSAGFTTLYHQMTKEQDEKLNGYDDTTQSDAANDFNSESDKLTELEDQLNDQSHGYVSDYTSTGFNTGVLTTLSSSLIFVTTWFANFWNMGGIFTAGLNLCFSLSIVFFILKLRR